MISREFLGAATLATVAGVPPFPSVFNAVPSPQLFLGREFAAAGAALVPANASVAKRCESAANEIDAGYIAAGLCGCGA